MVRPECRQYIAAIRIVCGDPPEGARLRVVSQAHEYGVYWEVAADFDPHIREACEYAVKCDEQAPTTCAAAGLEAPVVGRRR